MTVTPIRRMALLPYNELGQDNMTYVTAGRPRRRQSSILPTIKHSTATIASQSSISANSFRPLREELLLVHHRDCVESLGAMRARAGAFNPPWPLFTRCLKRRGEPPTCAQLEGKVDFHCRFQADLTAAAPVWFCVEIWLPLPFAPMTSPAGPDVGLRFVFCPLSPCFM